MHTHWLVSMYFFIHQDIYIYIFFFVSFINCSNFLQSVVLESLAFYFDSDSNPWVVDKPWEDLLPSEWSQVFFLAKTLLGIVTAPLLGMAVGFFGTSIGLYCYFT